MALLLYDGFDYINNTSSSSFGIAASLGYYGAEQPYFQYVQTGVGRFGGNAMTVPFASFLTRVMPQTITAGFVGFANNLSYAYISGANAYFGIGNTANTGQNQFTIQFLPYGVIGINDSTGTQRAVSGINAWLLSTYQYIEIGYTISATAGSVSVKINGVVVASVTNISTVVTTTPATPANSNTLVWTNTGRADWFVDDLYVCDNTGSAPYNTYLGNIRCQALLPTGTGSLTQFLKSSTSLSNWQCAINQNCDDTLYVYSPTVGNGDLYAIGPALSAVTVLAVQARGAYRQDDATQRSGQTIVKSGSVYATTTAVPCSQNYAFQTDGPWITDPNTGAAWVYSNVNALQVGPKVAA